MQNAWVENVTKLVIYILKSPFACQLSHIGILGSNYQFNFFIIIFVTKVCYYLRIKKGSKRILENDMKDQEMPEGVQGFLRLKSEIQPEKYSIRSENILYMLKVSSTRVKSHLLQAHKLPMKRRCFLKKNLN